MKRSFDIPASDWVNRVNGAWLVQNDLNHHAEAWLDHLSALDDGRFETSCEAARSLCRMRDPLSDPKPWFYAGLFSLASPEEARRFLASHRITLAAIPAMEDDEEVKLWMDRVGPETRQLMVRLRQDVARLHQAPPA